MKNFPILLILAIFSISSVKDANTRIVNIPAKVSGLISTFKNTTLSPTQSKFLEDSVILSNITAKQITQSTTTPMPSTVPTSTPTYPTTTTEDSVPLESKIIDGAVLSFSMFFSFIIGVVFTLMAISIFYNIYKCCQSGTETPTYLNYDHIIGHA